MDPEVAKFWNQAIRYIRLEAEQGAMGRIDSLTACKNIQRIAEDALHRLAVSEDEYVK